eukprot:XP_001707856.1 Hypothetical protein GL50803_35128 [Giardia lamblia ATCC 50803]
MLTKYAFPIFTLSQRKINTQRKDHIEKRSTIRRKSVKLWNI